MELFVIKNPVELKMYKKEWSSILESNYNTNLFLEFEFFINWWNDKCPNQNVTIFGVKENLKVIAFFPFTISPKNNKPIYQMLPLPKASRIDFIVPHTDINRILMFLMDKLIENNKHAVFLFNNISDILFSSISAYLNARNLLRKESRSLNNQPIKDVEKNIAGKERLKELGDVVIDNMSFPQYKEFISTSKESFQFSSSYDLPFLEKLSQELESAALDLSVFTVKVENEMVAFSFVLNCRGRYEEYAYGFHPDFTIFGIEKVLSQHIKDLNNVIQSSTSNSIIVSTKTITARYMKCVSLLKYKNLARKKLSLSKSKSPSLKKYNYLLARLTETEVKGTSDFNRMTNIDILTSGNERREALERVYRKSIGYYSISTKRAFWINEHCIYNKNVFFKELPAQSIYLSSWKRQELEKQLSFIQKTYLPTNIYVLVEITDKESQEKLKLFGFEMIEKVR